MFGKAKFWLDLAGALFKVLAPFLTEWLKDPKGPILEKANPEQVKEAHALLSAYLDEQNKTA